MKEDVRLDKKRPRLILSDSESDTLDDWKPDGLRILKCSEEVEIDRKKAGLGDVRSREDAYADKMRSRVDSFAIDRENLNVDSLKRRKENLKIKGKLVLHKKVEMECRRSCLGDGKKESDVQRKSGLVNDRDRVRVEKDKKFRSHMLTRENFGVTGRSREDAEADEMRSRSESFVIDIKRVNVDSLKHREEKTKVEGKFDLHRKVDMERRRSCSSARKTESNLLRKCRLVNDGERVRKEKETKFRSFMLTKEKFGSTVTSREDAEADKMRRKKVNVEAERKSVNDGDRVRMPKDDKFCSFGLGLKRRADSFKLGQCIGINRKKIKTDSLEREDEKHEFKGKIITGSLSVEPSAIRRKGEGLTVDRHMEKDEKFQPGGLTTGLKHREDSFKSGQCIGINRKKIKTDSLEREGEKHEFKGKIISGSLPVDPSATRRKGEGLEVDRQMEKGEKFQSGGLTRDISRVPCHKGIRVLGKNGVLRLIPKKMYNQKEAKDNRNDSVSIGITEYKVITAKNHANQPELSSAEVEKIKAHEMKTKDFGILEEDVDECSSLSNKQKEKAQRNGRGNEMQLLRDRIKNMLLNAGWKIDFKPRRNKDYTDSIYVSPEGTGYWSIVKAYYALEKQLNCKNKGDNNHSLIPMEVLSILTRRRVKKVKEKKTKKRGDNDEIKLVKKNKRVKETMGSCNNTDEQNGVIGLKAKGIARKLKRGHLSENVGYSGNSGRRCTLLVRGSNKSANLDTDDYIPYAGKRTVLSWLIDSGTVPENVKVQYMNKKRTRGRLVGRITRAGIHCNCCSKIITVSKFEIHAGSKLSQPFQNILVETGLTLLQCLLDAWDKQDESERCGFHSVGADDDGDPNDDTCGICGDGGDLICCDGCPSTFHQSCLDIQILPPGEWHCPNCSCKFCGTVGGSTSQGDGVTASQLLSCFQCERRYHQGCIRETDAKPVYSNSLHRSFCGQSCRKLFKQLQKLLGLKNDLEAGFSWTLIRRFGGDRDISSHMLAQRADCNSKLAVALSIMDECFMPIIDQRSVINLIHNVLYNCGSNFNRLNYSGFYTVILERGDEIISAASIRIHGTRLAEMPFIGTRHIYRRQGMCRRLLNAIESALCSLNVEKLIIPAISELIHTWTEVFGFKPLEESHKQELRSMNMLVFPSTGLLQKVLLKRDFNEGNATSVLEDIELKSNHLETSEATNNLLMAAYVGSDLHPSDGGGGDTHEVKDEVSAVESAPPDTPHGSNFQASFEGTMCTNSGSPYKPPEPFDEGFCIHSDVAHHNKLKVENISPMASPIEPNLHLPGEVTLHNSHELNHGVTGLEPNVHASVRISVQDSSKAIIESLDAVAGSTFHASGGSIIQCKSEWLDKSQELASDASPMEPNVHTYCENTVHDAPGRKVEGASVEANIPSSGECTTSENHIVNEVNSEVAAVECKHPTLGEDSVPYVLKAVSKTLLVASEPNCQTFSDVAVVLPVDALHHNLHEHNMRGVSNGSIMASPRKSNIQGTLIDTDTHRIEVGSAEVIAESLNEPNIQSSGGSCVHHNSKMMYKFTKSILDASLHDSPVVNEFIITSVEPKFWSPDDGAVHDNHELKDEVAPVELNVHTSVESSLCYTS